MGLLRSKGRITDISPLSNVVSFSLSTGPSDENLNLCHFLAAWWCPMWCSLLWSSGASENRVENNSAHHKECCKYKGITFSSWPQEFPVLVRKLVWQGWGGGQRGPDCSSSASPLGFALRRGSILPLLYWGLQTLWFTLLHGWCQVSPTSPPGLSVHLGLASVICHEKDMWAREPQIPQDWNPTEKN